MNFKWLKYQEVCSRWRFGFTCLRICFAMSHLKFIWFSTLCLVGVVPVLASDDKTQPSRKTAAVIFLHGLGDDGDGFRQSIRAGVSASGYDLSHVAWLFPKAPRRPVSLNGGAIMASWYDIKGLSPEAEEDSKGYAESANKIESSIAKLLERHPLLRRDQIIVGGFSQGAVISLSVFLRSKGALAGIVALSGYLPERALLKNRLDEEDLGYDRRKVPVMMCHGTRDKMVKLEWGKESAKLLKDNGADIRWKTFPIDHSVSDAEQAHVLAFMRELLPQQPPVSNTEL